MYCCYCGERIENTSKYCCYCGKKTDINEVDYSDYYTSKRYIITLNELIFYRVLLEIAKELNLILLCQVSLYSIIQTKKYKRVVTYSFIFFDSI